MKSLYEEFEVLENPRDVRGKKYKLITNDHTLYGH